MPTPTPPNTDFHSPVGALIPAKVVLKLALYTAKCKINKYTVTTWL